MCKINLPRCLKVFVIDMSWYCAAWTGPVLVTSVTLSVFKNYTVACSVSAPPEFQLHYDISQDLILTTSLVRHIGHHEQRTSTNLQQGYLSQTKTKQTGC